MSTSTQLTRPGAVTRAYRLSLLVIVVGILSNVSAFFGGGADDDVDQLKTSSQAAGVDPERLLYAAAIFMLLSLFVEMLLIVKMRDGSNKARIILTILTVLQVVSFVTSISRLLDAADSGLGAVRLGAGILTLLLGLGALFSMYTGEANRYFKKS